MGCGIVVRDTAALGLQVVVSSMIVLAAVSGAASGVVCLSVASEALSSIDLDLAVRVETPPAEVAAGFARLDSGYPAVGYLLVFDTSQVSGTFAGCGRGIWCHKCSSNVLQNVF